jgi:hypothetical protein
MTPEAKVKKKVVDVIKKNGAYYFFPATGGYGRSGVPDIVCCYRGMFVAIECKAGSNKPTALQEAEMYKIGQAQGFVLIVNEDNVPDVQKVFDTIDKGLTP